MERSEILERVRREAVDKLEVDADAVVEAAHFADDLDADSLDMVELVTELEESFEIKVSEEELDEIETVGQVVDLVLAKLG